MSIKGQKMQDSNISFTSRILFTNLKGFNSELNSFASKIKVDRPWSADEIIKASQAYTEEIFNCTAGGIITETKGKKRVVMFHINPTLEDDSKIDFSKVKEYLLKKIGKDKPVQGFLIGGKKDFSPSFLPSEYIKKICKISMEIFDDFENFMEGLKIPYTKFKGQNIGGQNSRIAYNSVNDQWTITTRATEKFENIPKGLNILPDFDEIVISPKDTVISDFSAK